jgi:DNA replication protein DnaC
MKKARSYTRQMPPVAAQSAPALCPRCNGSGWLPLANDSLRVEPCGCQGDMRRRQRIAAANIPRRYYHCRIGNFHDRGLGALVAAKRKVQELIDAWPLQQLGLLLMGGCGAGKTHLAVAALMEIIQSGKPGKMLFCNFQDLIQDIQASFDSDQVPTKSELLQPLAETDLLVLDELGSQKPTTFVQDILYAVINRRYNDERVTIFTTNYTDDLSDRIGDRLRSRLHEMTEEVRLTAVSDYRIRKNQNTL